MLTASKIQRGKPGAETMFTWLVSSRMGPRTHTSQQPFHHARPDRDSSRGRCTGGDNGWQGTKQFSKGKRAFYPGMSMANHTTDR